ncbi:hypothetical protein Tco_0511665 [Tanacetum coccineum]
MLMLKSMFAAIKQDLRMKQQRENKRVWMICTTILEIVEQKVKKSTADNNDEKNLAFLTTSSPSSTNTINTVNTKLDTKAPPRAPRVRDNRNWNQGTSTKTVRIEDTPEKAIRAIDDSEVQMYKSCLQNYEALKKQYDDLLVKLDDTSFKAATYKRGLSILEAQVVNSKEYESFFLMKCFLKEVVGHKEYLRDYLRLNLKRLRKEKVGLI